MPNIKDLSQKEYFDLLVEQGFITRYVLEILIGETRQIVDYIQKAEFTNNSGKPVELTDIINAETLDIFNTFKQEAKQEIEISTMCIYFREFLRTVATYVGMEPDSKYRQIPFEVFLPYMELCDAGHRGSITSALLAIPSTSLMNIPGATRYAFRQAITTVSMLHRANQLNINPLIQ